MWQYNFRDDSDSLMHWKYVSKKRGKNGKWQYNYGKKVKVGENYIYAKDSRVRDPYNAVQKAYGGIKVYLGDKNYRSQARQLDTFYKYINDTTGIASKSVQESSPSELVKELKKQKQVTRQNSIPVRSTARKNEKAWEEYFKKKRQY